MNRRGNACLQHIRSTSRWQYCAPKGNFDKCLAVAVLMLPYEEAEGFDWDAGNLFKVWQTHHVLPSECEQVFANRPGEHREEFRHSGSERRYFLMGDTDQSR